MMKKSIMSENRWTYIWSIAHACTHWIDAHLNCPKHCLLLLQRNCQVGTQNEFHLLPVLCPSNRKTAHMSTQPQVVLPSYSNLPSLLALPLHQYLMTPSTLSPNSLQACGKPQFCGRQESALPAVQTRLVSIWRPFRYDSSRPLWTRLAHRKSRQALSIQFFWMPSLCTDPMSSHLQAWHIERIRNLCWLSALGLYCSLNRISSGVKRSLSFPVRKIKSSGIVHWLVPFSPAFQSEAYCPRVLVGVSSVWL